jgi:hypothetical protein
MMMESGVRIAADRSRVKQWYDRAVPLDVHHDRFVFAQRARQLPALTHRSFFQVVLR